LAQYPYCGHTALVGKTARPWQDVNYVLGQFGKTTRRARSAYIDYVKQGMGQGRKDELTGGGLIRSLGGWSEVKRSRKPGQAHGMSDERILGDSEFVESVLARAAEKYDYRYDLKRRGYDLNRVARRVAEIYGIEPTAMLSPGRQKRKVQARSLFCFWAVRELGVSLRELAGKLGLSAPAVGFSVERGEAIARENDYRLID
jgi:hypothetical protein